MSRFIEVSTRLHITTPRQERIIEGRKTVVKSLIEYGLFPLNPGEVSLENKSLIELAFLNGRRVRNGQDPLTRDQWTSFLVEVERKAPRARQFDLLKEHGF